MSDNNFELKDSGARRTFASGAVRDRGELKPRPDLVSPHAQLREGMIFARGAEKYEIRNWEQGMPISECLASAQRHIEQYKRGDTDEDHIAQARWNLGAIIHYEEEIKAGRMDPSVDDMPKYVQQSNQKLEDGSIEDDIEFCPRCHTGLDTAYYMQTGREESSCRLCGWTSLDAPSTHTNTPTFYIAGPMRGYKNFNFPAFDAARNYGKQLGYNIISPADLDRECGIDPFVDPSVNDHEFTGDEIREIIQRDIEAITSLRPERGDGIAVLPGWQDSTGARAEIRLAQWLGLCVVMAGNFTTPEGGIE